MHMEKIAKRATQTDSTLSNCCHCNSKDIFMVLEPPYDCECCESRQYFCIECATNLLKGMAAVIPLD